MINISEGKTYNAVHSSKGAFQCKIIYIGKLAIYAILTDKKNSFNEAEIGDEIKLTKGLVTFKEVNHI
jgi:hypothetical protein